MIFYGFYLKSNVASNPHSLNKQIYTITVPQQAGLPEVEHIKKQLGLFDLAVSPCFAVAETFGVHLPPPGLSRVGG